jgi:hypothetical protein
MVTDKDILLKIKEKLVQQGKPSYKTYESEWTGELEEEIGSCAYFNDFGYRCAVGHIINPDVYEYEIEDKPVNSSDVIDAVAQSNPDWNMDVRSIFMLGIAQRVHDIHFERLEELYSIMEKYFDENGKFDLIEYREEYGNWFLKEEIYSKVKKLQEDVMKDFVTGYDFRTALREEYNHFISTEYYIPFIKIMEELSIC